MSEERRRQVEPELKLWLENDGSTAHLVNAAGAKIASGHIVPTLGAQDLVRNADSGAPIECLLRFEGTVV